MTWALVCARPCSGLWDRRWPTPGTCHHRASSVFILRRLTCDGDALPGPQPGSERPVQAFRRPHAAAPIARNTPAERFRTSEPEVNADTRGRRIPDHDDCERLALVFPTTPPASVEVALGVAFLIGLIVMNAKRSLSERLCFWVLNSRQGRAPNPSALSDTAGRGIESVNQCQVCLRIRYGIVKSYLLGHRA